MAISTIDLGNGNWQITDDVKQVAYVTTMDQNAETLRQNESELERANTRADDYQANRATQIGMDQRNRQMLLDSFMGNEFMKKNYDLQLQKIGMISALDNRRQTLRGIRADLGDLITDPQIKKEMNLVWDQYLNPKGS